MSYSGSGADLTTAKKSNWRSVLQAVLSFIASIFLFGLAALFLGLWAWGGPSQNAVVSDRGMFFTLALVFLTLGLLTLPSAISSLYRIKNRALPAWLDTNSPRMHTWMRYSILALPFILGLGWLAGKNPDISGILLPLLGILAICLPLLWLVHFGCWDLEGGSPQRKWGLLGLGLTGTPLLIIFVEVIALIIGLAVFAIWASSRPEVMDLLTRLGMQFTTAGTDLDAILESLQPYLTQPSVIFWIMVVVAVITPLIEETLKPLGVWLLAGRQLSPSEGYVAGLISGAGFALIEGLFNLINATDGQTWIFLTIGRVGGSLLHIFTGGLTGWGLASTWRQGKPLKFLGTFSLSVFIHGLWNAFALAAALLPFILQPDKTPNDFESLLYYLPVLILGLLILAAYISFTLLLRRQSQDVEMVK